MQNYKHRPQIQMKDFQHRRTYYSFAMLFFVNCLLLRAGLIVKTIENGAKPLYGEFGFDFIEKSLFQETDLFGFEYAFSLKRIIQLDSEGNIYVLVPNEIHIYNDQGSFIKRIAEKRGEGPGELRNLPNNFDISSYDDLYACDGYRIVKFNKKGEFVKNISVNFGSEFMVLKNRILIMIQNVVEKDGFYFSMNLIDEEGKNIKALYKERNPNVFFKSGSGSRSAIYNFCAYSPSLYMCRIDDTRICYGYNEDYLLRIIDNNGNEKLSFSVGEKKEKVRVEEKMALIKTFYSRSSSLDWNGEKTIFPQYRPFFKGILSDEKGRIWVIRVKPVLDKSKGEIVDIFDSEGHFLYFARLPYMPKAIHNGCVYVLDRKFDDEGDEINWVKKLVIKNYEQIK